MASWADKQALPQRQRRSKQSPLVEKVQAERLLQFCGPSTSAGEPEVCGLERTSVQDAGQAVLRVAAEEGYKFEYLDHTADVQLHAWGATLAEAFENTALAMFNYMTPLRGIVIDESLTRSIENQNQVEAEGHDLHTLLFNFLDELLFIFSTELLVFKELHICDLDLKTWKVQATGKGEKFQMGRHASGTEVKAITYSAMQVNQDTAEGDVEVFVIVDI